MLILMVFISKSDLMFNKLGNLCIYNAGKHMPTFTINQSEKIKTEGGGLTMSKTFSYSTGNRHISKKWPSTTTEERTKAFDNANAFSKSSKFPNFLKIMKKTGVTYGFAVVSSYLLLIKMVLLFNSSFILISNIWHEFEIALLHRVLYSKISLFLIYVWQLA